MGYAGVVLMLFILPVVGAGYHKGLWVCTLNGRLLVVDTPTVPAVISGEEHKVAGLLAGPQAKGLSGVGGAAEEVNKFLVPAVALGEHFPRRDAAIVQHL